MLCIRKFASLLVAMSSELLTKMLFASVNELTLDANTPLPAASCTFINDSDGEDVLVNDTASDVVR